MSRRRLGQLADGSSPLGRPGLATSSHPLRAAADDSNGHPVRAGTGPRHKRRADRNSVGWGSRSSDRGRGCLDLRVQRARAGQLAREQGWKWGVLVGNPNTEKDPTDWVVPRLAADRLVGAYSAMTNMNGGFSVDGADVTNVLVFDPLKGAVFPPLLEGQPPARPARSCSAPARCGKSVGMWDSWSL